MTLDKNKATELLIKINQLTPKLIILLIISWIATPILISIGTATNLVFFSILGFLVSFISSILFWGLIICIIINVAKNNSNIKIQTTRQNAPTAEYKPQENECSEKTEEYTSQEQDYMPQQEYNYNTSYNTSEINYAMTDKQAQKQFEKEIFTAQHPILGILQYKIIPFFWLFAILCAIITGVMYLLNHNYGIKLHF